MAGFKLPVLLAATILSTSAVFAQTAPAPQTRPSASPAISSNTEIKDSQQPAIDPDALSKAYKLLQRGYALLDSNQLEQAAEAFEQALQTAPDSHVARVQLALVQVRLQNWPAALPNLKKAADEEPDNQRLHFELGHAYENTGDLENAQMEYGLLATSPSEYHAQAQSALLALAPKRVNSLVADGKKAMNSGDQAAARNDFERALALDPRNAAIVTQLGYVDLAQGDAAAALKRFEAAQRLAPDDASITSAIRVARGRLESAQPGQPASSPTVARSSQPGRPQPSFLPAQPGAEPTPVTAVRQSPRDDAQDLSVGPASRVYFDVTAQPMYDTRFSEGIADLRAHLHIAPSGGPINFYFGTSIIRDFGANSTTRTAGTLSAAKTSVAARADDSNRKKGEGNATPIPVPIPIPNPAPAPAPQPAPTPDPIVPVSTPVVAPSPTVGASLSAGLQPAIFSDNVALTGGGFEIHPQGSHVRFAAEANLAYNFLPELRGRTIEPDFRAVLAYSREWLGFGLLTLGQIKRNWMFSDLDASAGYYSRYDHDGIGYIQARDGFEVVHTQAVRLAPYVTARLVKDTKRDFFNNTAEAGAGIELRPAPGAGVAFRVEYFYGHYYGSTAQVNPYEPHYHSLRFMMTFGHRFFSAE